MGNYSLLDLKQKTYLIQTLEELVKVVIDQISDELIMVVITQIQRS